MNWILTVQRQENRESAPYIQRVRFESDHENETVATALKTINDSGRYLDEQGQPVGKIAWEAGCLQKKCGACAMLINGQPRLACDTFLRDLKEEKPISLAPLSKFPVIKDLVTDRTVLFDNLKKLQVWAGENARIREKDLDRAYDASRCLQCACCLEACPEFRPEGDFMSAAAFAPLGRLVSTYSRKEKKGYKKLYQKHIYAGCGKALACMKVCPAQIDLDRILSRSNAISVWHRR